MLLKYVQCSIMTDILYRHVCYVMYVYIITLYYIYYERVIEYSSIEIKIMLKR